MSGAPTADLQIPVSATQDPQRRIPETSTSTRIDNDQGIDLEDVHSFFSDDNDRSFISSSDETEPLGPPPSALSRISTRFSTTTVATAVPRLGVIDLSLSDVCKYIGDQRSLQNAEIISTECYAEKLGGVTHRFLLLEMRRSNRKDVWLRLDRRRGQNVSLIKFLAFSGVTKANDRASITANKDLIINRARAENRQVFRTPPTLNQLRILLTIICEEIVKYRLWPENCWFFCSLIQQHLEGAQSGWFENGCLKYAGIAQGVRLRVATRVWTSQAFIRMTAPSRAVELIPTTSTPPPVSRVVVQVDPQLLEALRAFSSEESFPSGLRRAVSEALAQIEQMQTIQSLTTISASDLCREVIRRLDNLGEKFNKLRRPAEEVVVMRAAVMLQKDLSTQDPSESEDSLARLMSELSVALYATGRVTESCAVDEEIITILRRLYENDPAMHGEKLAIVLHHYALALPVAKRKEEAFAAHELCVKIRRELYSLNPKDHVRDLVLSLNSWGSHLVSRHRYPEARDVLDEGVSICREWFKIDETHGPGLAGLLRMYAVVLHSLGLIEQACEVGGECIALYKQFYGQDPAKYRDSLELAMKGQWIHLHAIGRIEEADAIREERGSLMLSRGSISDSEGE